MIPKRRLKIRPPVMALSLPRRLWSGYRINPSHPKAEYWFSLHVLAGKSPGFPRSCQ